MTTSNSPTPVARIFVSHSHQDDAVGKRLVGDLRARLGQDAVWYDSQGGLLGGENWWRTIVEELSTRNIFIVILSPDAVASAYVQTEMDMAHRQRIERHKILIPLRYRPCTIPEDWKGIQSLPLIDPDIDPDAYRMHLTNLFAAIEHALITTPPYTVEATVVPPLPAPTLERAPDKNVDPEWERWENEGGPTRFRVLNFVMRGGAILLCSILLIPYWLGIGYTTPAIFPYPILRTSKSAFLIYRLRGNGSRTQLLKALIVFAALTLDWFLAGVVLTRVMPVSLLPPLPPLGPANTLGIAGVVVFFILLFVYLGLWIGHWPYLNVVNFRKMLQVSVVTTLLFFASQIRYFGVAFLYFPILAMVVSLLLFLYKIVGLGGSSYGEWGTGYNAGLEERRQEQLADDAYARAYFERKRQRKSRD
ncbi:MAG TPA: toll/interleukin-1 receptor domain-containing protein [Ktedonobacterales bacterium]